MSPIAEGTAALVAGEIGGDAAGRGKDVVPPRASMVERREAPPPYVTGGRAPSQRRAAGRVMVRQGALAKRPAPPGAPFPSPARETEKGKGHARRPKIQVPGQRKRWLFDK